MSSAFISRKLPTIGVVATIMVHLFANKYVSASTAFIPASRCRSASRFLRSTTHVDQQRSRQYAIAESANIEEVSLYRCEGLFCVEKPMNWTSNDVVSFIRKILERDARERGAKPAKVGSRGAKKKRVLKVGHGGTLDPLATGVLVVGVGQGTKELQSFLSGSKRYIAGVQLGFETTTLDLDPTGNVTRTAPFDHVSLESIEEVLAQFRGTISQVPPVYSAIRKEGKKLYQLAREGKTADDVGIEAREVVIHELELISKDEDVLPQFHLDVECGGGTYIRSLVRDIGDALDSAATMISLERTKQGQFSLNEALPRDEWSPDNFYAAIERLNLERNQ